MACLAPELWSTTTITRFRPAAASSVRQNPPRRRWPRVLAFFLDHRRDPRRLPPPPPHSHSCRWCGAPAPSLELSWRRKCSLLPPLLPIGVLPLPGCCACARLGACVRAVVVSSVGLSWALVRVCA
uniref:Uncharacterized protein n=1 Tax=Arundo donax TaxID=35708 RepID=A0A0A9GBC2_ARUDO